MTVGVRYGRRPLGWEGGTGRVGVRACVIVMVLRLAGPLGCVLRVGTCAVVAVGVAPIGIGGGCWTLNLRRRVLLDGKALVSVMTRWWGGGPRQSEMRGW